MFFELNVCSNTNLLIVIRIYKYPNNIGSEIIRKHFSVATTFIKNVINDIKIFFMKT